GHDDRHRGCQAGGWLAGLRLLPARVGLRLALPRALRLIASLTIRAGGLVLALRAALPGGLPPAATAATALASSVGWRGAAVGLGRLGRGRLRRVGRRLVCLATATLRLALAGLCLATLADGQRQRRTSHVAVRAEAGRLDAQRHGIGHDALGDRAAG